MTTEAVKLEVQPRTVLGKKVGRLRRAGIIPVHLYGPGIDSRPLQCGQRDLLRALARSGGSTPVIISVEGESAEQLTLPREVQWHPVRGGILHVDFLAVSSTRRVPAQVPINLVGETDSGQVAQMLRELTVEALPMDIPSEAIIDLGTLDETNSVIRVADITFPSAVTVLTDGEEIVVRVEIAAVGEEPGETAEQSAAEG